MNLEKERQKNPLSHVGGINAHASVGESKEHEGGDRINPVDVECTLIERRSLLNFLYSFEAQITDNYQRCS